jgi:hypothetical protein
MCDTFGNVPPAARGAAPGPRQGQVLGAHLFCPSPAIKRSAMRAQREIPPAKTSWLVHRPRCAYVRVSDFSVWGTHNANWYNMGRRPRVLRDLCTCSTGTDSHRISRHIHLSRAPAGFQPPYRLRRGPGYLRVSATSQPVRPYADCLHGLGTRHGGRENTG